MLDIDELWRRRTGLAHFLADSAVLGTWNSGVYVIVCVLSERAKAVQVVTEACRFAAPQLSDHA